MVTRTVVPLSSDGGSSSWSTSTNLLGGVEGRVVLLDPHSLSIVSRASLVVLVKQDVLTEEAFSLLQKEVLMEEAFALLQKEVPMEEEAFDLDQSLH